MAFSFIDLLSDWESFGVFDYVLPFLLIFALVYGILVSTNVFSKNTGVNLIVALAVGLLSLRFDYVPLFFSEIFPRFGMGLAIILVIALLTAIFVPKQWFKGWSGTMWAVGAVIAIVVIYKSFDFLGWNLSNSGWWDQYGSVTILGILIVILIASIIVPKITPGNGEADYEPMRK